MSKREIPVSLTLAEIARVAGVGRAAVSNWRRRYDSFPQPVGGTDASPQFALGEVEVWLRENGKFGSSAGALERLWPRYEALGDRDRMGYVVAEVGARLCGDDSGSASARSASVPELTDGEQALVDDAVELARLEGNRKTFRFLLERWLGTHVRQIATTPSQLAELMTEAADECRSGAVRTVVDPACGTGGLLLAAARRWVDGDGLRLVGCDRDPVLAQVATARLVLETDAGDVAVSVADTLRDNPLDGDSADVILCNPPANERDWGYAELATDQRWLFGQPPRTESELAWVQHIVSALVEDGVAAVLLPPAVASRRAGRRIRAALLRAGVIRAVVALPPGAAPPYGVGLHLWILCSPREQRPGASLLLVDTADCRSTQSSGRTQAVDWEAVRERVLAALRGAGPQGSAELPVVDLLGEETDLTPARHISATTAVTTFDLRKSWTRFDAGLQSVRDVGRTLHMMPAAVAPEEAVTVSVAELEQADAVTLTAGQSLPEELLRRGTRPDSGVPVLTAVDPREPQMWMLPEDVEEAERQGRLTVTASGDVVVVGATHAFAAWVDVRAPVVIGPQLHRLRVEPERLDPWFLAACLRVPSNARQAGTHASVSSRIDVRRLRVLRLPLGEQRRYGEVHRKLVDFEQAVTELTAVAGGLGRSLAELLAAGRLDVE